ncbi:TIM barrel protein [Flavihumibacter fluvii]|uniref:TIM barrel protein n=1 Tax=Flavihumibacter fluvii TaxID=2838157 RepID=UPI001BDF4DEA|nr:TIM barrel protein [Flavihumibacter fluvii]ULQ54591.1 TIM barrel protein [Flavihumibacter fluvii]
MIKDRRNFIKQCSLTAASLALANPLLNNAFAGSPPPKLFFEISLAEFSFASDLWGGKMTNLDFPAKAKKDFGISTVEYVAMFFNNKHTSTEYLADLKKRAEDVGVKNNLIMVDGENLSDLDDVKRKKAVESHYSWVDAAKYLGCSAIRVNLGTMDMFGSAEDEAKASVDGYGRLLEYGAKNDMDIIVENHTGRSCDAQWLTAIMKEVNHPRAGVLPDFGNFCINRTKPATQDIAGYMATKCLEQYDLYKGVEELMPYAKGVSAKTHKFKANGDEAEMDFNRLFTIIKKSGFSGYVGIEYEGGLMRTMGKDESYLLNDEGVMATKKLLEKVGKA